MYFIIVGLLVFCPGLIMEMLFKYSHLDLERPYRVSEDLWNAFLAESESQRSQNKTIWFFYKKNGYWIGCVERFAIFSALWFQQGEYKDFIAVLFTFKIAAKWEAWSNIAKMPEKIVGVNDLEYLWARRHLGGRMMGRFFVGSLLNLLIVFYVIEMVLKNLYRLT